MWKDFCKKQPAGRPQKELCQKRTPLGGFRFDPVWLFLGSFSCGKVTSPRHWQFGWSSMPVQTSSLWLNNRAAVGPLNRASCWRCWLGFKCPSVLLGQEMISTYFKLRFFLLFFLSLGMSSSNCVFCFLLTDLFSDWHEVPCLDLHGNV